MPNIVNVGYNSTNHYLVESEGTTLLVDCGLPGTLPRLRHAVQRAGTELAAIDYLLVTHFHPDHAGLVQELKQLGLKFIVADLQLPLIPVLARSMKPGSGFVEISTQDSVLTTIGESRSLLQRLRLAGEIIATPGHSADSISLVLDAGAAFTGDLALPLDAADELTQLSWAKLRASLARTIYPGHGPCYPVPR